MELVAGYGPPWADTATGFFLAIWDLLRLRVRGWPLSLEEKRRLGLVEFGASTFGAPLLSAHDLEDLQQRLDEALEQPGFFPWLLVVSSEADSLDLPTLRQHSDRVTTEEKEVLGSACADELHKGLGLLLTVQEVVEASGKRQALADKGANLIAQDPLALLTDKQIAVPIRQIYLSILHLTPCLMGIVEALLRGRELPPWLALGLVNQIKKGAWDELRLLASLPEMEVSPELCPLAERLDLALLRHQVGLLRQDSEAVFQAAAAARDLLDLTPPLYEGCAAIGLPYGERSLLNFYTISFSSCLRNSWSIKKRSCKSKRGGVSWGPWTRTPNCSRSCWLSAAEQAKRRRESHCRPSETWRR